MRGIKLRHAKTMIEFALERDDLKQELVEHLQKKRLASENGGQTNLVKVYTLFFGTDYGGDMTATKACEEGNEARTIDIAALEVFKFISNVGAFAKSLRSGFFKYKNIPI